MRVLLLTHMPHLTTLGGAQKVLRSAMELLAQRGHEVRVVSVERSWEASALPRGTLTRRERDGILEVGCGGVGIVVSDTVREMLARGRELRRQWQPDVVVVPGEDPLQRPLREALTWHLPVVLVCQTPATLPFGEGAANPGCVDPSLFSRPAVILANSRFLASYLRNAGFPALHVRLPAWPQADPGPDPGFDDRPYALSVNPSIIKGLPLFLMIAAALPQHEFAAVPGWATEQADVRRLCRYSNVSTLPPSPNVYDLLRQARVLLVPSLWLENTPLVITEAMLAGVPVIASALGGIPEVMLGTGVCLPVTGVAWRADREGHVRPRPPRQDAGPWIAETARMMENKQRWAHAREEARRAAIAWLSNMDADELEGHLLRVAG